MEKKKSRRDLLNDNYKNTHKKLSNRWNTDDFDLTTDSNNNLNDRKTTKSRNNYDNSKSNRNYKFDNDDDSDDGYTRQTTDYQDMFASQDRPRNTKVDDIYRTFIQKIMDLLGVDEQTARFYRSAIKIKIGQDNPELKKRENDELKVKEMEKLFENKKKLQTFIDTIDMDHIKEYMAQQKKEGDRRKEGINKNNKTSETSDATLPANNNNTNTLTSDTTSKSKTRNSSTTKPTRTAKSAKQSRIVDNSYLQSDEIIFSPN